MLSVSSALELLRHGEITIEGRLVEASNATLFCDVADATNTAQCVYKPIAGERPLWDFPDGTLAAREVAAYAVSEASGWSIVPPTVLREGPFGPGMCQLWMDVDPEVSMVDVMSPQDLPTGWLCVLDALGAGGRPVVLGHADDPRLRRMALLDAVLNNADRKGGHVLPLPGGRVLGVDHGVSFHVEEKLRTVLWGWAGQSIDAAEVACLETLLNALNGHLGAQLATLLTRSEVAATRRRTERLLGVGRFPLPPEGWPAIPWPPF